MHILFFTQVSHATIELGSYFNSSSKTESEIKSDNLSGWPADTDSEVNKKWPLGGYRYSIFYNLSKDIYKF